MHLTKTQVVILGVVAVAVVGGFLWVRSLTNKPKAPPVALTVWGTDPPSFMEAVDGAYQAYRPNVAVIYKQTPAAAYDETLVNALAAGAGPDVYLTGNHSVARQRPLLQPADPASLPSSTLSGIFPAAVAQDFVVDGKVWGLPLYLDTLALISNRDLLNQAAIVYPPATWVEFQDDVNKLKVVDSATNRIQRAGAALGGSEKNIADAADIVQALMLQNGVTMTDAALSSAKFDQNGGPDALAFYLQFGDAASPAYTWNESQPDSRAAFAAGRAAMIVDYQAALAEIKNKNPFVAAQVSALPQVATSSALAYPSYQGLVVSKQSKAPGWAWDFIYFAAATPQVADAYSKASGRPPALLSLINEKINDPDLGVFARQALVAKSWFEADDEKVSALFNDAMLSVMSGKYDVRRALKVAADQTTVLMGQRP